VLTAHPLTAIAGGAAAGIPLLLQTCARETALYQLLGPDAAEQADGVLAGYFGSGQAAALLASYRDAYPDLDATALRVTIMSDERYMARTEMLADAQAAHAPVWRSRYDGPYFGRADDPGFARFAPLLAGAHGGDGAGIWLGGEGVAGSLHQAWGAFAAAGDPGWPGYAAATGRTTTIFEADGPRLAADPFAHVRATWLDLTWQPGTWWPVPGLA
jgi:para-nitrobenzyl esterase